MTVGALVLFICEPMDSDFSAPAEVTLSSLEMLQTKDCITLVTCTTLSHTLHTPTSTHFARKGMSLQEGATQETRLVLRQCSSYKYALEKIVIVCRYKDLVQEGRFMFTNKRINKDNKQLQCFCIKPIHLKSNKGKLNTFFLII